MLESSILPAFVKHPNEGAAIGRLLAGYGELELDLCQCLAAVLNNLPTAIRVAFRTRGEEQRILTIDALIRLRYIDVGLGKPYTRTLDAMRHCKAIRNQYAHCHWLSDEVGLYFGNLEDTAKRPGPESIVKKRRVDMELLERQEGFFINTRAGLWHLFKEYRRLKRRLRRHNYPMPPRLEPPPKFKQMRHGSPIKLG